MIYDKCIKFNAEKLLTRVIFMGKNSIIKKIHKFTDTKLAIVRFNHRWP